MSKSTKTPAIVSIPAFNAPIKKIVDAFNGVDKAAAKLGDTVLAVAPSIPGDKIDVFCAMLKSKLEAANPDKAGSIKTQVSYIRRVVTAIVVEGREVAPGQSLRGLYEALPKAQTGGASHARKTAKKGASHATDKPEVEKPQKGDTVTLKGDPVEQAALLLFGTAEAYTDALRYARDNAVLFQAWAHASMRAREQTPAPVTALKATTATGRRATTKRTTRKAA